MSFFFPPSEHFILKPQKPSSDTLVNVYLKQYKVSEAELTYSNLS